MTLIPLSGYNGPLGEEKDLQRSEHRLQVALQNCKELQQQLNLSKERLRDVIAVGTDILWEHDQDSRLTLQIISGVQDNQPELLGRCPWDLTEPVSEGGWEHYRSIIANRQPLVGFLSRTEFDGKPLYFKSSGIPFFDEEGVWLGYRGITTNVTTKFRAAQLLSMEHAITRELTNAETVAAALQSVMRVICTSERWGGSVYWKVQDDQGSLRLQEFFVAPGQDSSVRQFFEKAHGTVTAPGDGVQGEAYRLGDLLWVPDITQHPSSRYQNWVRSTSLRAAMFFPIVSHTKVIGLFSFSSTEIRKPDAGFIEAVSAIASQINQYLQRAETEQILRESEERFRGLTLFSSDWYWDQDEQFRFVNVNGQHLTPSILLIGKTLWDPDLRCEPEAISWDQHQATLEAREVFRDLIVKSGTDESTTVYYAVSGQPFFAKDGSFKGYRGVAKDITEQKRADERIKYLANHDGLTSLPNRVKFSSTLQLTIEQARRLRLKFAVLFIDLDRFKIINDTLGHEAGDQLLSEIGIRLKHTVREGDVVARLGGDEFVVLLAAIDEPAHAAAAARKILSAVIQPLSIAGQECRVTASIGIALYPADATTEQALMKNADIAMYRAKEAGKNIYEFYSESLKVQSLERLALESSLRRALERSEFFLHYQAKLDLKTRRVTGVEALLRWQHPELGIVSPLQFIPLAEETGLIVPIGKWVLKTACAQNMAWQSAGLPPLSMAINLSARQFADENLLDDIYNALEESKMPATLLELELTESMVMQNHERAHKILVAIKKLGARIAIDDFGVGYSSLAQIKRFPIDTLKVDRSFIRDLPANAEDRAITEAIISLGKTLSLTVVAEGVETLEQEAFLRDHACDQTQGFLFSKPISADQFAELLRKHLSASLASG